MVNEDNTCAAVAVKIPPFWAPDPQTWFTLAESQFALRNITSSTTKFHHILTGLSSEMAGSLVDIISNPPTVEPYETLKKAIISRLGESQQELIQRLFQPYNPANPQKPSKILINIHRALGTTATDSIPVRRIFMQQLPPTIRTFIAASKETDMQKLAEEADEIFAAGAQNTSVNAVTPPAADLMEIICHLTKEVASLKLQQQQPPEQASFHSRPRSPASRQTIQTSQPQARGQPSSNWHPPTHRQETPSDICWYHSTFRNKARKCTPPCKYSGNF